MYYFYIVTGVFVLKIDGGGVLEFVFQSGSGVGYICYKVVVVGVLQSGRSASFTFRRRQFLRYKGGRGGVLQTFYFTLPFFNAR